MTSAVNSQESHRVGLIVPPAWYDNCADELRSLSSSVRVMTTQMRFATDFNYTLDEVRGARDEITQCALALARADCELVAQIGTPFSTLYGWQEACDMEARIATHIGVPFEMMGLSLPRLMRERGLKSATVTTVYYESDWTQQYRDFLASAGIDVLYAGSFAEQGIEHTVSVLDSCHHEFDAETLEQSVRQVCERASAADCVVIAGIPCPQLTLLDRLEAIAERPVMNYLAICVRVLARLGLTTQKGSGSMFEKVRSR